MANGLQVSMFAVDVNPHATDGWQASGCLALAVIVWNPKTFQILNRSQGPSSFSTNREPASLCSNLRLTVHGRRLQVHQEELGARQNQDLPPYMNGRNPFRILPTKQVPFAETLLHSKRLLRTRPPLRILPFETV